MIIDSRSGVGEHGMPTADRETERGLNRLNPSFLLSLSLSAYPPPAQPTVQRTSKDRGSTRSFARSTAAAVQANSVRARQREVEQLSGRMNPRSNLPLPRSSLPLPPSLPPSLPTLTWAASMTQNEGGKAKVARSLMLLCRAVRRT